MTDLVHSSPGWELGVGHQYFKGGETIGGAAESGLGKITVELGIPGLFVMGWFAISLFRHLRGDRSSCVRTFAKDSPTFLWPFQFSHGQRGGVLGCHTSLWRFVHIADLELDACDSSGNSRTAQREIREQQPTILKRIFPYYDLRLLNIGSAEGSLAKPV